MKVYIEWYKEEYYTDPAEIYEKEVAHDYVLQHSLLDDYLGETADISLYNFSRLADDYFDDWVLQIAESNRYSRWVNHWFCDYLDDHYDCYELNEDKIYYVLWDNKEIGTFDELTKNCNEIEYDYVIKNMVKLELTEE